MADRVGTYPGSVVEREAACIHVFQRGSVLKGSYSRDEMRGVSRGLSLLIRAKFSGSNTKVIHSQASSGCCVVLEMANLLMCTCVVWCLWRVGRAIPMSSKLGFRFWTMTQLPSYIMAFWPWTKLPPRTSATWCS